MVKVGIKYFFYNPEKNESPDEYYRSISFYAVTHALKHNIGSEILDHNIQSLSFQQYP